MPTNAYMSGSVGVFVERCALDDSRRRRFRKLLSLVENVGLTPQSEPLQRRGSVYGAVGKVYGPNRCCFRIKLIRQLERTRTMS